MKIIVFERQTIAKLSKIPVALSLAVVVSLDVAVVLNFVSVLSCRSVIYAFVAFAFVVFVLFHEELVA